MNRLEIKDLNLDVYTYNQTDKMFLFDKKEFMVTYDNYSITADYIKIIRFLCRLGVEFEELEDRFIKLI